MLFKISSVAYVIDRGGSGVVISLFYLHFDDFFLLSDEFLSFFHINSSPLI